LSRSHLGTVPPSVHDASRIIDSLRTLITGSSVRIYTDSSSTLKACSIHSISTLRFYGSLESRVRCALKMDGCAVGRMMTAWASVGLAYSIDAYVLTVPRQPRADLRSRNTMYARLHKVPQWVPGTLKYAVLFANAPNTPAAAPSTPAASQQVDSALITLATDLSSTASGLRGTPSAYVASPASFAHSNPSSTSSGDPVGIPSTRRRSSLPPRRKQRSRMLPSSFTGFTSAKSSRSASL
jgi:hypothetical protein